MSKQFLEHCCGLLCLVSETVAPGEQGLAYKSQQESQERRWQAQPDTNTEGPRGKSGLKNIVSFEAPFALCSPVDINQMFKFKA